MIFYTKVIKSVSLHIYYQFALILRDFSHDKKLFSSLRPWPAALGNHPFNTDTHLPPRIQTASASFPLKKFACISHHLFRRITKLRIASLTLDSYLWHFQGDRFVSSLSLIAELLCLCFVVMTHQSTSIHVSTLPWKLSLFSWISCDVEENPACFQKALKLLSHNVWFRVRGLLEPTIKYWPNI